MATPKVYVICDQNCKFESMTKEQILSAIMQAVNEGTIGDIDAGFIQTIKTINGKSLKFFYGEQAAFDALTDEEKQGVFAIITNDATIDGLKSAIEDVQNTLYEMSSSLKYGGFVVAQATSATSATSASYATRAGTAAVAESLKEGGNVTVNHAERADHATTAGYASSAGTADKATNAENDESGNHIPTSYARIYNGNMNHGNLFIFRTTKPISIGDTLAARAWGIHNGGGFAAPSDDNVSPSLFSAICCGQIGTEDASGYYYYLIQVR